MTISRTDIIFARVYRMGREIANLRFTGMTLLDLVLRNGTQGWSDRRPVML